MEELHHITPLEEDIRELQYIIQCSCRESIRQRFGAQLASWISQIPKEIQIQPIHKEDIEQSQNENLSNKQPSQTSFQSKHDKLVFTKIINYKWEQEFEFVNINIPIDDIGAHSLDKIECDFKEAGLDLKVFDFEGKNLRLILTRFFENIDVKQSKFSLSANSIKITILKEEIKKWDELLYQEPEEIDKIENPDPAWPVLKMFKKMFKDSDWDQKTTIMNAFYHAKDDLEKRKDLPEDKEEGS